MRQALTGAGCGFAALLLAVFFAQPAGGKVLGIYVVEKGVGRAVIGATPPAGAPPAK